MALYSGGEETQGQNDPVAQQLISFLVTTKAPVKMLYINKNGKNK